MTVPVLAATTEVPTAELAGRSDILVLGPSLGSTTASWNGALAELSQNHTVVRWDLPGHGRSPVATTGFSLGELAQGIIDLLDSLGVDSFAYAGVSVGGALSLELALRFPDRVKAIIPICTGAKLGEPAAWDERADLVRAEGPGVLIPVMEERWFSPEFRESERALVDDVMDMIAAADKDSYAYLCQAIGRFDVRDELNNISAPVLVISGELDPGTPPAAGAVIADGVQHGRLEVVAGAYHQAAVEHPLVVARLINAFLADKK